MTQTWNSNTKPWITYTNPYTLNKSTNKHNSGYYQYHTKICQWRSSRCNNGISSVVTHILTRYTTPRLHNSLHRCGCNYSLSTSPTVTSRVYFLVQPLQEQEPLVQVHFSPEPLQEQDSELLTNCWTDWDILWIRGRNVCGESPTVLKGYWLW
jgi:hypothetical protein